MSKYLLLPLFLVACGSAPGPEPIQAEGCTGYAECFYLRADPTGPDACGLLPDGISFSLVMGQRYGILEPAGGSPAPACSMAPFRGSAMAVSSECIAENGVAYSQQWALDVSQGNHWGVLRLLRLSDGCLATYTVVSSRP